MVFRVYVEKRPGFDIEAQHLLAELRLTLNMASLTKVRIVQRYDVEGISHELFTSCIPTVFSEPPCDRATTAMPEAQGAQVFAVESLPGQFDQRASSAAECIQLISQGERPSVRSAKLYYLEGVTTDELARIRAYLINPVESRAAKLAEVPTLKVDYPEPEDVKTLAGFITHTKAELAELGSSLALAMDQADLEFCQAYFAQEERNPTITEIRMIDTYWSDHCRHTTFGTVLDDVQIDDEVVRKAFDTYLNMRRELKREDKPMCLMDMATIGAKYLAATDRLHGVDESEEVNACTVRITVDVNGSDEDWLFLFKNETHNHPTEIEPFGGAATCIGGAIRDPLSGRSYVYQAMRITGASNPLADISETLEGRLSQRKIVTTAADGYSSYGNQVGLATGQVHELYHPGYLAKHMELGAVVGATPARHVRREEPVCGDVVVLLGGRTGRDGIGGATGSSKAHNIASLEKDGAEVQKGNALVERKLQRLFRREDACQLIKRCNDFGAGGVAVAIGELADGLDINLDLLPKKYEGLDGTELAISESQERMAVVLAPEDVDTFLSYAYEENLEASPVATVTNTQRLRMSWRGTTIVDISREFLSSNGAPKHVRAHIQQASTYRPQWQGASFAEQMTSLVSDINVASNKGLAERFDSTIGAATVLMPFGGATQLTPPMAMVAKLPVIGETTTCSGMAWGYNPYISEAHPYTGAYLAVVESLSKLVAAGLYHKDAYLSFQEYFGRLRDVPERWGQPTAALLGALMAQNDLSVGSIGGKDSMSGSFENLDVPPTLVSFAVACGKVSRIMSPEFKAAQHQVAAIVPAYQADGITPEPQALIAAMELVEHLIDDGSVCAVATPGYGGPAEALFKMCVGNHIGIKVSHSYDASALLSHAYGSFIVELTDTAHIPHTNEDLTVAYLGETTEAYVFDACNEQIDLSKLQEAWEARLEPVYPYRSQGVSVQTISSSAPTHTRRSAPVARPRVLIPVFPGNNCEYDTAQAFERAGAIPHVFVVNNLTPQAVAESCAQLAREISKSQIVMIPGGFSGGDEPDGSAKFITAFFRAPEVEEAVHELLQSHDGLMLGICNGFQALIKLGLVPYGTIRPINKDCPTLTHNTIGRHQSRLVHTRVASTLSPWLSRCEVGDIHSIAISHGEGRFVASDTMLQELIANGQVATQYVDEAGQPSMSYDVNPNGSCLAIEGISSADGRILGKMGHSERTSTGTFANVAGNHLQPIFEGGVRYFTD